MRKQRTPWAQGTGMSRNVWGRNRSRTLFDHEQDPSRIIGVEMVPIG
jgi:hypothetical protein